MDVTMTATSDPGLVNWTTSANRLNLQRAIIIQLQR